MKTNFWLSIFAISLGVTSQAQVQGSYMAFGGGFHSIEYTDENTISIQPCKNYHSELSAKDETFEFKKMENGDFGWLAYDGSISREVILKNDQEANRISFPDPINMRNERSFLLMHKKGAVPASNVKTYVDETIGGYSNARILVTDSDRVKNGNCLIHSAPVSDLNSYLVGNYHGVFDENWQSTFNADFTGTFLGLPMTWSLVSDDQGKLIQWGGNGSFFLYVMIEFEGQSPNTFDPVESGKKVAGIYGVAYFADEKYIEIHQMQKKM